MRARSLLEHYDLPGHFGTVKTRKVFDNNKLISYTYKCPFQEQWRNVGVSMRESSTISISITLFGKNTGMSRCPTARDPYYR
jgi:hypothetical protein